MSVAGMFYAPATLTAGLLTFSGCYGQLKPQVDGALS